MEKREFACESWNYGKGIAVAGVLTITDSELIFHPRKEPLMFWVKRQDIVIKICDIKDLQPDGLLRLNVVMSDDLGYTFRIYVRAERQLVIDGVKELMEIQKATTATPQTPASEPTPMGQPTSVCKFCPMCGSKVVEGAQFCAQCGHKL